MHAYHANSLNLLKLDTRIALVITLNVYNLANWDNITASYTKHIASVEKALMRATCFILLTFYTIHHIFVEQNCNFENVSIQIGLRR